MPRDHARIFTAIWSDDDFVALPASAQRLYMLLLSQDGLSYAGHQDLRVGRWASRAADTGPGDVRADLDRLDGAHFLLADEGTEEVLIRSYIRGNEVWKQPKLLTLALRQAATIQSRRLRHALREELLRLPDDVRADAARAFAATLPDTPGNTPFRTPAGTHEGTHVDTPTGTPVRTPGGTHAGGVRAHAGARVTSNPEQVVGLDDLASEGIVTEADAREREQPDARPDAVPDTRPAPLDDLDPEADERAYTAFVAEARQRTTPPVSPIEGAMPPARCHNHLELADPPPCGRCADARRAQEAWIADRDAKMAAARAEVAAEVAASKAAEREAIDRCTRCDDRGITDSGVRCTHDARVDTTPGRAAFQAEREKLRQRTIDRARTEPATGDQLRKLAITFGEHGTNDRGERLAWCSRNAGRDITSMTQLSKAEASQLIELLERAKPVEDATGGRPTRQQEPQHEIESSTEDPQHEIEPPTEDLADPRWSDPGWERVPLTDGGPDDPGTFIPRLDPADADEVELPSDEPDDDPLPPEPDDDPTEPGLVYAGQLNDEPPFAHKTGFELDIDQGRCIV